MTDKIPGDPPDIIDWIDQPTPCPCGSKHADVKLGPFSDEQLANLKLHGNEFVATLICRCRREQICRVRFNLHKEKGN